VNRYRGVAEEWNLETTDVSTPVIQTSAPNVLVRPILRNGVLWGGSLPCVPAGLFNEDNNHGITRGRLDSLGFVVNCQRANGRLLLLSLLCGEIESPRSSGGNARLWAGGLGGGLVLQGLWNRNGRRATHSDGLAAAEVGDGDDNYPDNGNSDQEGNGGDEHGEYPLQQVIAHHHGDDDPKEQQQGANEATLPVRQRLQFTT